ARCGGTPPTSASRRTRRGGSSLPRARELEEEVVEVRRADGDGRGGKALAPVRELGGREGRAELAEHRARIGRELVAQERDHAIVLGRAGGDDEHVLAEDGAEHLLRRAARDRAPVIEDEELVA